LTREDEVLPVPRDACVGEARARSLRRSERVGEKLLDRQLLEGADAARVCRQPCRECAAELGQKHRTRCRQRRGATGFPEKIASCRHEWVSAFRWSAPCD